MSDDLISRQEVIQAIRNERVWVDENIQNPQHHYHIMNETTRILSIIGNLPNVQSKTGRWICDYKGDHVADYHCSECGRQLGFAFSTQNKKILGGRWKYCDVCGAKMKGETE